MEQEGRSGQSSISLTMAPWKQVENEKLRGEVPHPPFFLIFHVKSLSSFVSPENKLPLVPSVHPCVCVCVGGRVVLLKVHGCMECGQRFGHLDLTSPEFHLLLNLDPPSSEFSGVLQGELAQFLSFPWKQMFRFYIISLFSLLFSSFLNCIKIFYPLLSFFPALFIFMSYWLPFLLSFIYFFLLSHCIRYYFSMHALFTFF